MEFDLQKILFDMQKDIKDGFADIREKHEDITKTQWAFEMRLKAVEVITKNAIWFLRAGITAFITFIFDLVLHHLGVKL